MATVCVHVLLLVVSRVSSLHLSYAFAVVPRVPWVFWSSSLLLLLSAFVANGRNVEDEGVRLGGRQRRVPQGHPGVRKIVRQRAGDF